MRFRKEKPYCLVLSGGGAKGVYHIGAWRALRELKVPVAAFVGNSIGAIAAAFLAQGAFEALEELGRTISLDGVVKLPSGFLKDGIIKLQPAKMPRLGALYREFAQSKGLDTSPMRRTLESRIDEGKIRRSGNDLGVVTVNVSDLKPREVFLDEMEEGSLVDYLMASSAVPGFSPPVIEGKKYVDGGLWDNIPYAMARKRGYTRLIVIDVSGAGVNRRPDVAGSATVYVRNSIDMGGLLDFDRKFLDAYTELGYLDTLRVFGRYKGYSYFVEPDERLERRFRAFAENDQAAYPAGIEFPEAMRYDRDLLLKYLECAAAMLNVERIRAYGYRSLAAAVEDRLAAEDARLRAAAESGAGSGAEDRERRRGLELLIRESLRRRTLDDCPYYTMRLVRAALSGNARTLLEKALRLLRPELDAGFAYLDFRSRFPPLR